MHIVSMLVYTHNVICECMHLVEKRTSFKREGDILCHLD